jgi:DNA-binding transcriptional ArsR family regulator
MNQEPDEATLARAGELFAALSNPTRLKVVEALRSGEKSVGEVAAGMHIGLSGASQHLAILARAGVIASHSKGTSRYYKIRGPRIEKILDLIFEFCHVHRLYGAAPEEVDAE